MMPIAHSGVNKTLGRYPQNEQYNRKGEGARPASQLETWQASGCPVFVPVQNCRLSWILITHSALIRQCPR